MKYKNRLKRKQFVRDVKWKLKQGVRATVDSITKYLEGQQTFYEIVFKHIKEGLDWCGEVRYYMYDGRHFMPSIESEYGNYKVNSEDKLSCEELFNLMVDKILPMQFSRYTDLEIVTGENEYGKYFEIKLVD